MPLILPGTAVAETKVTLANDSGRRLCAAVGGYVQAEASSTAFVEGWSCADDGGSIVLEPFDGRRFLSIIDGEDQDYVAAHAGRYQPALSWVPLVAQENFGLQVMALDDGTFSYSQAADDGSWSAWEPVSSYEDLEARLAMLDFRQVRAWIFDSASLGATASISLKP